MDTIYNVIFVLFSGFLSWRIYQNLRANPEQLSSENLSKSSRTMGYLALFLILIVGFAILQIRSLK